MSTVVLYVKSAKMVVGTKEVFQSRIWARDSRVLVKTLPRRELVLSEDQQKTVEIVRRVGRRFSLEVEVVDVAKENLLHRFAQSARGNIRTFPALVAGDKRRLEGELTEERVESFLRQVIGEEKKTYL